MKKKTVAKKKSASPKWGVWCTPPSGTNDKADWLRDVSYGRARRVTFTRKADAVEEARISNVGLPHSWTYEARRILP